MVLWKGICLRCFTDRGKSDKDRLEYYSGLMEVPLGIAGKAVSGGIFTF